MQESQQEIGNIVRDYRNKAQLTQMELAKKLGYNTPQFVSLFERGLSKIPLETLGHLIVILNIPERKVMRAILSAYEETVAEKIHQGKRSAEARSL